MDNRELDKRIADESSVKVNRIDAYLIIIMFQLMFIAWIIALK